MKVAEVVVVDVGCVISAAQYTVLEKKYYTRGQKRGLEALYLMSQGLTLHFGLGGGGGPEEDCRGPSWDVM